MRISFTNNLEFKSKIYVLSPEAFNHVKKRINKKQSCERIENWYIRPDLDVENFDGNKYWYAYRKNVDCGYTEGIRTCTGGIAVNKGKKAPIFWHVLNSETNKENLSIITNNIEGTNVFMVGAKNKYKNSFSNFHKIFMKVCANKIPITALKGLSKTWEANIAYESSM